MSLTSNLFILFVFITVVLYYILPHKIQWLVLLAASYVYYIYSGPRYVYFILFSTLCSYLCGRLIEKFAENKDENGKTGNKKLQKAILICGLILNFGMLGIIKYTNFVQIAIPEPKTHCFIWNCAGSRSFSRLEFHFTHFRRQGICLMYTGNE